MSRTVVLWHGTRTDFDRIDVGIAGAAGGYGQHGVGLYLTTCRADALSFSLPSGYVWRCEIDAEAAEKTGRVIELGAGITHYVLTDQAAILSMIRTKVVQHPVSKLSHRKRLAAVVAPADWGLCIFEPDVWRK